MLNRVAFLGIVEFPNFLPFMPNVQNLWLSKLRRANTLVDLVYYTKKRLVTLDCLNWPRGLWNWHLATI